MKRVSEFKRVIVDEYSQIPSHHMNFLNNCKKTLNIQLLFFGDSNQCLAVSTDGNVYNYIETDTFQKMCNGNKLICSYMEQFSRYDKALTL